MDDIMNFVNICFNKFTIDKKELYIEDLHTSLNNNNLIYEYEHTDSNSNTEKYTIPIRIVQQCFDEEAVYTRMKSITSKKYYC